MKNITFTSAGGYPGVIWPTPEAQLPNETEEEFLQRLIATALPRGATNPQIIDEDSYVPPEPPAPAPVPPTPREWLERLGADKQAAITEAVMANASLMLWLFKAMGSSYIDVTAEETIAGVAALVTSGVLDTADQTPLLAP